MDKRPERLSLQNIYYHIIHIVSPDYIVYRYIYIMVWSRHTGARNTSNIRTGKRNKNRKQFIIYIVLVLMGINSAYYQYWSSAIMRRRREHVYMVYIMLYGIYVYRREREYDSKSTRTICVGELHVVRKVLIFSELCALLVLK